MRRVHVPWPAASAILTVVVATCTYDWEALDPRLATSSSSAGGAAAGAGGVSMTTTSTTSAGGHTGGSAGSGGNGGGGGSAGCSTGGAPGTLVDRGLLTRYYLDEADSGVEPTQLMDAAPAPLNLAITYSGGNVFTEVDCQRGMSWPGIELDGRAASVVLGTKIETALDGNPIGTIECVFELSAASAQSSRISHIGTDTSSGRFTLFSDGPNSLGFDWDDQAGTTGDTVEEWSIDLASLGRIVAHLVLDTRLATADDRVRLYVDGIDQGVGDLINSPMLQDSQTELIAATDTYVIGNRTVGVRSFQGTLYYCAMYGVALTPFEVTNNATVLLASDDMP